LRRELLIAAGPGEWRAALLEDGVPAELFVERGDRSETGSIHLGRVIRLIPGLGAALVDIGGERPAFLPQGEVAPHGRRLNEGERVLVQIRREAQGGKAARATMAISLRGRLAEMVVGRPNLASGEGLTAPEDVDAAGFRLLDPASANALTPDLATLRRRWRDILDLASRLAPPARLDPIATLSAALANGLSGIPDQLLADDPVAIPDLSKAFPQSAIEHRPQPEWPIDLDAAFDNALCATIALPDSGSVHFETTRAGVLIDVDTGTPETGSPERIGLATNLAATASIARQIRLRNLGGPIVIDFVGSDDRGSRERLRAGLAAALASDPRRPQILGWTRLGHLELVRPRRGRPLAEALLEPRPGGALVKTAIAVAHEALRALRREARAQPGRSWRLIVSLDVAAALTGGAAAALEEAERRFARKLAIETDAGCGREQFQIIPR
jgi:ribonuclease G